MVVSDSVIVEVIDSVVVSEVSVDELGDSVVVIIVSPLQDTGNDVGQFASFGWKQASVFVEFVQ